MLVELDSGELKVNYRTWEGIHTNNIKPQIFNIEWMSSQKVLSTYKKLVVIWRQANQNFFIQTRIDK